MVVGLPTDDIAFPAIMMREIRIRSVATGTRDDQRAVLDLAASGAVRCLVETCDLSSINATLDKMRRGEIFGRISVKM